MKEDLREQIMFADAAIRELKKQRYQLEEEGSPVEELTSDIDKQMEKLMDLTLQYTKA
jgi:hypothetical protein